MGNCCYTTSAVSERPQASYNATATTSNPDQQQSMQQLQQQPSSSNQQSTGSLKSSPVQQAYTVTPSRGPGTPHDPMFNPPPPPPAEPQQLEHIADREGMGKGGRKGTGKGGRKGVFFIAYCLMRNYETTHQKSMHICSHTI